MSAPRRILRVRIDAGEGQRRQHGGNEHDSSHGLLLGTIVHKTRSSDLGPFRRDRHHILGKFQDLPHHAAGWAVRSGDDEWLNQASDREGDDLAKPGNCPSPVRLNTIARSTSAGP
jgi:hypothetical protein